MRCSITSGDLPLKRSYRRIDCKVEGNHRKRHIRGKRVIATLIFKKRVFILDKLMLGAIAGIIPDILDDLIQLLLIKWGFLRYDLDEFAGSVFIRTHTVANIKTPVGQMIGFLSGVALSIILGIVFVYLIQLTGFRLVKTKGFLYGLVIWFLIYGGIRAALHFSPIHDYNPKYTLVELLIHMLFGWILGAVVAWLGEPALRDNR